MGTSRPKKIGKREKAVARIFIKGIREIEEEKEPVSFKKAVRDTIKNTFGAESGKNKTLLDYSISTSRSINDFVRIANQIGINKAISKYITPSKDIDKDIAIIISEKLIPKDIYPEIRERMIRTHLRTLKRFLKTSGGN